MTDTDRADIATRIPENPDKPHDQVVYQGDVATMVWGPYRDWTMVTTDEGMFGLEGGCTMRLEQMEKYDPKQQRKVLIWYPVYERVVPLPGPLETSLYVTPADRTPNLANYAQGVPSEWGSPKERDKLATLLEKLVPDTEEKADAAEEEG